MARFRNNLPQQPGTLFLTDGGIETTLIFHYGLELPDFAAFTLLRIEDGTAALTRYFRTYAALASRLGVGLILESPTWRANRDWGERLGYASEDLAIINREAITLMQRLRNEPDLRGTTTVISGNLGPRGDGYVPSALMSASEAERYHQDQIRTFAETEADLVSAFTINYVEEAIGIASAARACAMPVVISFTVETDGKLPTGDTLRHAVEATDDATDGYPTYYMINCAHPTHFQDVLVPAAWVSRVRGLRSNASAKSHAQLNEAAALDQGDPVEFGSLHRQLRALMPQLCVVGGCCGTDQRHVEAACKALRQ